MHALAGHLCVVWLRLLRRMPERAVADVALPFLALYPLLRRGRVKRLRALWQAVPRDRRLRPLAYYRTRLSLFLHMLRWHGRTGQPAGLWVEGTEHFQAALASGRPILVAGLHLGPYEWLHRVPAALARDAGRTFQVVTAPAFSPPLTRFMTQGRARTGSEVVLNTDLAPHLKEIARTAGILGVMLDQTPEKDPERVILWGKVSVPSPLPLMRFAAAQGFSIIPVCAGMFGNRVYVRFLPPLVSPDEAGWNTTITRLLEDCIRKAPEQWNWSYPGIALHPKPRQ